MSYREVAVGFDGQRSRPSPEVEVELVDTVAPPPPSVTRASGRGGVVHLELTPAAPPAAEDRWVILRGGGDDLRGVVVGEPLPASTTRFTDSGVLAGEGYWYAVVALDGAGNRSRESERVAVVVGAAEIPPPASLEAELLVDPFPRVELHFPPPPHGLSAEVQRQLEGDDQWLVTTTSAIGEALDLDPPAEPEIRYRVLYRSPTGAVGSPSPEAVVRREVMRR